MPNAQYKFITKVKDGVSRKFRVPIDTPEPTGRTIEDVQPTVEAPTQSPTQPDTAPSGLNFSTPTPPPSRSFDEMGTPTNQATGNYRSLLMNEINKTPLNFADALAKKVNSKLQDQTMGLENLRSSIVGESADRITTLDPFYRGKKYSPSQIRRMEEPKELGYRVRLASLDSRIADRQSRIDAAIENVGTMEGERRENNIMALQTLLDQQQRDLENANNAKMLEAQLKQIAADTAMTESEMAGLGGGGGGGSAYGVGGAGGDVSGMTTADIMAMDSSAFLLMLYQQNIIDVEEYERISDKSSTSGQPGNKYDEFVNRHKADYAVLHKGTNDMTFADTMLDEYEKQYPDATPEQKQNYIMTLDPTLDPGAVENSVKAREGALLFGKGGTFEGTGLELEFNDNVKLQDQYLKKAIESGAVGNVNKYVSFRSLTPENQLKALNKAKELAKNEQVNITWD